MRAREKLENILSLGPIATMPWKDQVGRKGVVTKYGDGTFTCTCKQKRILLNNQCIHIEHSKHPKVQKHWKPVTP